MRNSKEITKEKIFEDGEEVAGAHTRHPNRNEDKSRERSEPDSRRGSITRQQETGNSSQPEHDNHLRHSDGVQDHFYVLILSKKCAKFFRGDVSGLHHIEMSEMPDGIA